MSCFRPYRVTGIAACCVASSIGLLSLSVSAEEEPAQGERAAAEVMFEAGREAMEARDYDLACEKFEASMKLDPAPGTLLNLGNCEEQRGRIASAWERYIAAQRELPDTDRRKEFAAQKVEQLEADVPRLTITIAADAPEDTQVRRDEIDLTGSLGVPLPLDPGTYAITATADGYDQRSFEIHVGLGDEKSLEVWPGDKLPEPKKNIGDVGAESIQWGPLTKRQWGYVAGGVGLAGIATMATTGVLAYGAKTTADEHCARNPMGNLDCDPTGGEARKNGETYATIANVAGVLGVAALGTGVYFILTSNPPASASSETEGTRVEVGSFTGYQGVRVTGKF